MIDVIESLTVTSPVTARTLPLKVRFALSSIAPLVPAITTLLSVRSPTIRELVERSVPS